MTPPIPEPRTRPAYRDPRLRFEVTHILTAAHLVMAGFPLLNVMVRRGQSIFLFGKEATVEFERFNRATDELAAYRERSIRSRVEQSYSPSVKGTDYASANHQ